MSDICEKNYVDLEDGLERVRNNTALFKRMLQLFLQSEEFPSFERELSDGNLERAAEIAHAIKGMTGNLGFPMLFETSSELMTQLRQGIADQALLEKYRDAVEKTTAIVGRIIETL